MKQIFADGNNYPEIEIEKKTVGRKKMADDCNHHFRMFFNGF